MKYRSLMAFFLAVGWVVGVTGQPAPGRGVREIPTRPLFVANLTGRNPGELQYENPQGQLVRFHLGENAIGSANPVPLKGNLVIYRVERTSQSAESGATPASNPSARTVTPGVPSAAQVSAGDVAAGSWSIQTSKLFELPLPIGTPDQPLLLVFFLDAEGRTQNRFVPYLGPEEHPARTLRLINFSPYPVAVKVSDNAQQLAPGDVAVIRPNVGVSIPFTYQFVALQRDGQIRSSSVKRMRFFSENERMVIVFAGVTREVPGDGEQVRKVFEISDIRFFERLPERPLSNPRQ